MFKQKIRAWLGKRFDLKAIEGPLDYQLRKPLPKHIGWRHTLGSLSLFLFISQILTGILLLIYYRPTANEAFESIKFIMTKPCMGWLYRQLHAWGADLMILIVFLHMFRTFMTGSFKKPRELTWMIGVMLFILTCIFGFTGYLLPWNQLSYWATTVGTEIVGVIPWIGEPMKVLMRGGPAVGGETLSRFFVIHVIILPWVVFFLVALHLFLVRFQGMSTMDPVDQEKPLKKGEGIPFFPHHVVKEGVVIFLLLGVLVTLAILVPFELGEKADPLRTPEGIKPEWYFMSMYQVLKYFPKLIGIFFVGLAPLLLFLWPFIDKSPWREPRQRPWSMLVGALTILSLLIFGILGFLSETKQTFLGKTYEFNIYGVPHLVTFESGKSAPNPERKQ